MKLLLLASLLLTSAPLAAQSPNLAAAIRAGQVGERFDGFMGVVGEAPADLRRQVAAVNLRRRNLYIELATRRNVTADIVGLTTGCTLLSELAIGQSYMLKDGIWRRRAAGQNAPVPDYCR